MNQFFNNKRMIVLLISVIVFISTIAISRNREEASIPQLFINDMAGISTSILSKSSETVSNFVDSVDHLVHTYEENQALKKKMNAIDEMQAKIYALEQENENMKQELALNSNLTEFEKISSTVIARNPDNWIDLIVIDKGSNDGIQVDMSVMSGNGLIGRVSEVSPTTAKVLLLSTPNDIANRVSAEIQNPKESIHGIIDGYDLERKLFVMSEIDPTKEINVGSQVVTSGLGGISPSSLLVGTVEEVKMDEFGLFQEVLVKPAGNMYDIRYVTVIVRQSKGG